MPKLVSAALTDMAVRKARPKDNRYDLYDAALRGFGVACFHVWNEGVVCHAPRER